MARLCVGCNKPVPLKARGMEDPPTAGYCSKSCYMHHYNDRRAQERWATRASAVHECPMCAATWCTVPRCTPRRYCSPRCKERAKTIARHKEQRQIPCAQCGEAFMSARDDARFCSKRCSSGWQRAHAQLGCSTPDCTRPLRAKGMCNLHYRKARGEKSLWTDERRDAYHRRRAQKKTTADDRPVLLSEIRERDGNRCHLCRKKISAKPYPHPLSASLDHVVPLSLDGEHVPENVRLAHLRCNVSKGNGGGNEQLLLIG